MTPGAVARLRDLVPIRPLTREEALRIAELQANRLLELAGLTAGPVSEQVIADLPRIEVLRQSPWPTSGATQWVAGRWAIVLNGEESATRQRFSLAHEFKHVLDHRFVDLLYSGVKEADRQRWIEQVCDYFAACLLMPRAWVKRAYTTGIQDVTALAATFDVSAAAMRVRLAQIGLAGPQIRCAQPSRAQVLALIKKNARYHRSAPTPALVT
jgi:predicted transcriptional regulator